MIAKGFKREDGPFVRTLDAALESFEVRRQSYYGGTFVGNLTLEVGFTNKHSSYSLNMLDITLCSLKTYMSYVTQ